MQAISVHLEMIDLTHSLKSICGLNFTSVLMIMAHFVTHLIAGTPSVTIQVLVVSALLGIFVQMEQLFHMNAQWEHTTALVGRVLVFYVHLVIIVHRVLLFLPSG